MERKPLFISSSRLDDPVQGTAFAAKAVFDINEHVPSIEEIAKCLRIGGLQGTSEEIQQVVELLPEELKPARAAA